MAIVYYKSGSGIQSVTIDPFSGTLQQGEDFIWSHSEQKGILHKHLSSLWAITNFRIFIYDAESNKITGLLMMSDLEDIVVMNTHRVYASTRVGTYGSIARGFGISTGSSTGKSVTVGDILFMSHGQPIITWGGITDPTGLKRLTTAIQKELYPKNLQNKIQGTTTTNTSSTVGTTPPNVSSMHDKSVCLNCNTKNYAGSSFCCKCGRVLR